MKRLACPYFLGILVLFPWTITLAEPCPDSDGNTIALICSAVPEDRIIFESHFPTEESFKRAILNLNSDLQRAQVSSGLVSKNPQTTGLLRNPILDPVAPYFSGYIRNDNSPKLLRRQFYSLDRDKNNPDDMGQGTHSMGFEIGGLRPLKKRNSLVIGVGMESGIDLYPVHIDPKMHELEQQINAIQDEQKSLVDSDAQFNKVTQLWSGGLVIREFFDQKEFDTFFEENNQTIPEEMFITEVAQDLQSSQVISYRKAFKAIKKRGKKDPLYTKAVELDKKLGKAVEQRKNLFSELEPWKKNHVLTAQVLYSRVWASIEDTFLNGLGFVAVRPGVLFRKGEGQNLARITQKHFHTLVGEHQYQQAPIKLENRILLYVDTLIGLQKAGKISESCHFKVSGSVGVLAYLNENLTSFQSNLDGTIFFRHLAPGASGVSLDFGIGTRQNRIGPDEIQSKIALNFYYHRGTTLSFGFEGPDLTGPYVPVDKKITEIQGTENARHIKNAEPRFNIRFTAPLTR